jgi:hypothetical protein
VTTLKTQIATDMAAIFNVNEFGETITYTPAGISPVPFTCIGIFEDMGIDLMESRVYRDVASVRILQSALTAGGITEPKPTRNNQTGDTITRGGVVWVVIDPMEQDSFSGLWKLSLEKDVRFIPT